MTIRRVTGTEPDGSLITVSFARTQILCLSASYGDGLETEVVREMASQAQDARTPGTYKTDDIKIKMRSTRFRRDLVPNLPKYGAGNVRLAVVVGFQHPDFGDDSDLLVGCRFTNWAAAYENSNKAAEVELTMQCLQILWTNRRVALNLPRAQRQAGATL